MVSFTDHSNHSRSTNAKILIEIQKYPSIYNYEDENYKNFVVKENGWKKVSFSVGKSVDSHHETEFANVITDDSTLDDSELDIDLPAPQMSNTQTIIKKSTQDLESLTYGSRCSTPMLKPKVRKSQTRGSKISSLLEFDERAQRCMDDETIHNNKRGAEKEDVYLFMKSISLTVKKFPPALINKVKLGILTLVDNLGLKAAAYIPHPVSGGFWLQIQLCNLSSVESTNSGHHKYLAQ
ncbi:hypothetical protein NQ314_020505, partial [Rhamnusium bicolor]